ncbi:PREDICTED: wall-associated receptor kinase-like 18 [Camelina sativa]|uniref:Wall-associated receptor kinase-like 18 n=1 Tax=Camelina sativa TaxID=90675 RepID=A0ABM0TXL1_CAMSA|nr:PREDICTED: wall-associated receptor kinase-like 18 [Camelina sativa]
MSYGNRNCSFFLNLFTLLLLLFCYSADLAASTTCQSECGRVSIRYPFGIGKGCYLEKYYEIECRRNTTSRKPVPFLSAIGKEVVSISPPSEERYFSFVSSDEDLHQSFGLVRVKFPITSTGCFSDGNDESGGSTMNFTGTPFFIDSTNSLIAVGCNSKVSLMYIKPNMVGCELSCNTSNDSHSNSIPFVETGCSSSVLPYSQDQDCTEKKPEETGCNGNGCCQASLPNEPQQVIGIRTESNDGNSTSKVQCTVAFLTDGIYTLANGTKTEQLLSKRYATVSLGWVIQTKNNTFLNSLACKDRGYKQNTTYLVEPARKCTCARSTISEISYVNCGCTYGYKGNPYISNGCKDIDECKDKSQYCKETDTCVNYEGGYRCVGDKTKAIMIGAGSGFGVLVLVGGVWWLRKFLIKRRLTKRKKKFFKRNGGLLLQQELNTREGNVEKTRIFNSRELEKATENFSENRVLGHGGQGTVYKGMLVDGRTVAVKKSKVIDEDKLQEFINEVVILSQINHRHVVKLLGCCLETEVPILVYEFIINGNLFQHIHEETDDYTMIWGMRLRIAVDMAGALSYLHSAASSPIYHRDIKSTNILLDEKYRAKVADFGTSRSVTIDQTHWTTIISGTVGYVDPEYYRSSQYTEKSDVYSFGVVLAELITGNKPVITVQSTQEIVALAEHFRLAMKEKRLFDIMDARIRDDCKPEQVMAVAKLAMKCLSSKGKKRPNMREVFTELEKICTSPEDSQVQNQIDEEEEEEEEEDEVVKIINRGDSWSIGVTAPAAYSTVASTSPSDVEPLFPRITW